MRRVLGLSGLIFAMLGSVLVLSSGGAGAIEETTCTVTEAGDAYRVTVNSGEEFGSSTLNFRDSSWIASGDPDNSSTVFETELDREPSLVIIRLGQGRADVSCSAAPTPVTGFNCAVSTNGDSFSVTVSGDQQFGSATLNFRDNRWIATGDPANSSTTFETEVNREPSVVIIRRGSDRADVPCTSAPNPPGSPTFQCFAIDTGAGFISAAVVASEPFGDASINYRDNRWIATVDPGDGSMIWNSRPNRVPTTAVVRINDGEDRFDIHCTDDLYDGVDIEPTSPDGFFFTRAPAIAMWDGNIVWGEQRFQQQSFRYNQTNYISRNGQDSVELIGGENWDILDSEVLCGGRLLGISVGLTDDPIGGVGVIDPEAEVMYISSEDGQTDADCAAGVVTFTDPFSGRTDTYEFNN